MMKGYGGGGADGGQKGYGGAGGGGDDDAIKEKMMKGYGAGGADGGQKGYEMDEKMQEGYGKIVEQSTGIDEKGPLCPDGQVPVAKRGYRIVSTGHRIQSMRQRVTPPERAEPFKQCASHHMEGCLQVCGITWEKCAEMFKQCMRKVCAEQDDEDACQDAMKSTTTGLGITKTTALSRNQKQACECAGEDEVSQRREQEVREFYKQWAPDQMSKVKGLLEKYPGKKFPNLMLALILKYVKAVEVKELTQEELTAIDEQRNTITSSVKDTIKQTAPEEVRNAINKKRGFKGAPSGPDAGGQPKPKKEVPVPDMDEL